MWAVSQAAAWSFSSLGIAWVIQPSGVVDKALEALDCVLGLQQRCERRIAYRLLDVVDRRTDAVEPGRGEVGVDEDRGRRRVVDPAAKLPRLRAHCCERSLARLSGATNVSGIVAAARRRGPQ